MSADQEQILADLEALEVEQASIEQAKIEKESIEQAKIEQSSIEQAKIEQAAQEAAYQAGAQMAVGFVEQLLRMRAPYVQIDSQAKTAVVEKLVPVLRKHGGGMPAWLLPYKEELELSMVLVGVGFGVVVQIQAHKAAEAATAAEAAKSKAAEQVKPAAPASFGSGLTDRDEFGRPLVA